MISILLCLAAFVISFSAGSRSMVKGLGATLAIGYFYGILRANLPQSGSHFIFDAAVVGLYIAQRGLFLNPANQLKIRTLQKWLLILSLWPILLLLAPVQDPLVELVGLRGHIFLLPFLLLGARLSEDDLYELASYVSCLNLVAFGFAVAEYVLGVERFFPHREGVTSIIYLSRDVADSADYRIPAIFNTAHAYAGTMVMTMPLLFGAWVQKHRSNWRGRLLSIALLASILGVFMAAARTPVILLCVVLLIVMFSGKVKLFPRLAWALMLGGVVWLVSNEARLQRFTTLQDTAMVTERILGSVNEGFLKLAAQYPLGNGLGGGGTSLPYFLQDRVKERPLMENEYARIVLEQGVPGLCLWIGFLLWAIVRRINPYSSKWALGRRLAWCLCVISFGTGFIGTGLLTAIPHTAMMLLTLGTVIRAPERSEDNQAKGGAAGDSAFSVKRALWAPTHI